jgi:hypothetical protein
MLCSFDPKSIRFGFVDLDCASTQSLWSLFTDSPLMSLVAFGVGLGTGFFVSAATCAAMLKLNRLAVNTASVLAYLGFMVRMLLGVIDQGNANYLAAGIQRIGLHKSLNRSKPIRLIPAALIQCLRAPLRLFDPTKRFPAIRISRFKGFRVSCFGAFVL